MKLTSEQEQQLKQVYEAYWAQYLKGNVKAMEDLLDKSYTQVGSAESEVFSTKKQAVEFLRNTIDEVAGKLEMRNRITQMEQQDAIVMFHERCELYALDGRQWVFYSKFRATTLLTERKDGWKIIHQHSSFPDSKTEEGQNVAIDKIAEENRELREAVKRRTVELEQKNRELAIEASLERVRARAMAMQNSDELSELVDTVFKELTKLDLALSWCMINIIDEPTMSNTVWGANPEIGKAPESYHMLFEDYRFHHEMFKAWKEKKDKWVFVLKGAEKEIYDAYLFTQTEFRRVPKPVQKEMRATKQYVASFTFSNFGGLQTVGEEPLSDESLDILSRFGKVFDLTYTRFNDLQKAEAQAREARIEGALERVRSRSMGMQKSEELKEVVKVIFDQLSHLSINAEHAGIVVDYEPKKDFHFWVADNQDIPARITVPYLDLVWDRQFTEAKKKGKDFFTTQLDFEEKNSFYKKLLPHIEGITKQAQDFYFSCPGLAASTVIEKDIGLYIENFSGTPYTEKENDILRRFAKVFQQTYTRFLDLQNAEAQAREAQIEVALERVRSKAMAMHHTDELTEVLGVLFDQFDFLGINPVLTHLTLFDEENETFTLRITTGGKNRTIAEQRIDVNAVESWKQSFANWKKSKLHAIDCIDYPPEILPAVWELLDEVMSALPEGQKLSPSDFPEGLYTTQGHCKYGFIGFNHTRRATEEEREIVIRFAKEFGRLYQRFLDIQNAEAQNREAQIEGALERVRSKTMAMHNSGDLENIVISLFDEVMKLGLDKSMRCGIGILEDHEGMETRSVNSNSDGTVELRVGMLNMTIHPMLVGLKKAWKNGSKRYSYNYTTKDVRKYYEALNKEPGYPFNANLETLPDREFHQSFFYSSGIIFAFSKNPISEESSKILARFAAVFGQTYRRYLDLQKAEAQAREAQIEAALERVRAKSMAMYKSEELPETAQVLFEQFSLFGNMPDRISIGIFKEEEKLIELWATDQIGSQLDQKYSGPIDEATTIAKMHKAWKEGNDSIVVDLSGKKLKDWVRYIKEDMKMHIDDSHIKGRRVQQAAFFSKGMLLCTTNEPVAEEIMQLLVRFAKVFDQTYTRFLDLQKAEAQAREAIKQASLDRVRGEIASMRSAEDLQRITPLVFNELTSLGVPFFRCGVFIIHEKEKKLEVYLSAPDGHSLGVLHLPFNVNSLTQNSVENWKKNEVYHQHWTKEDFEEWTQSMMSKGQIQDVTIYQDAAAPPDSLDLHFIPFTQGMLYVGNATQLQEGDIDLVRSLAEAFAIAYARYEDFTKLEKAKESIETTLTDLKQTQQQLVQSEKMASLGELTAGIAHEIQNPLNFVNNFSEVSVELIEEMHEELEKGDLKEALALADDVKQNLGKITHHGKRADGIVKGMLQHSRSSSGQKEPTDINALADEYFRLAYHGLRAKDKSFNVTMETDFDESIGEIKIVLQDIGRVILNLITNAFYAVNEKSTSAKARASAEASGDARVGDKNYEPTVSVSTRKKGDQVLISVKDNGNGIPKKVMDKIFQPFFTTKPTGEGTGLGLSMSYDIVKAHGGELKVETNEGEGSQFIIILPV